MKLQNKLVLLSALCAPLGFVGCDDDSTSSCDLDEEICLRANYKLDPIKCECVDADVPTQCTLTQAMCESVNKKLDPNKCECVDKNSQTTCPLTQAMCESAGKTLDPNKCLCVVTECFWNDHLLQKGETVCDGNVLKTCSAVVNTEFDDGRDCVDIDPTKPICDVNVCREEKYCGHDADITPGSIVCNTAGTNKAECIDGELVDLTGDKACTARPNASSVCTFTTEAICSDACNDGLADVNGACERIHQCDTSKEKYNAITNTCECDSAKHWTGTAESCTCDAGYVDVNGVCEPGCLYNDVKYAYNQAICNAGKVMTCQNDGTMAESSCTKGVCINGKCEIRNCDGLSDGETICKSGSLKICNDGTLSEAPTACTANQLCLEGASACVDKKTCTASGSKLDTATNTCVCDTANHWKGAAGNCTCDTNYVQISGKCELKKTCDSTKETYNSATNTCVCNNAAHWTGNAGNCTCASGYVQINGACQAKKTCDSTKETYNSTTNTCACNTQNHWTGNVGSCTCASEYTLANGQCIPTSNWSVGDLITFGHYEQDGDRSNGKEPISWRVLDKNAAGHYLIISEKTLDAHVYDYSSSGDVSWRYSRIRQWLNSIRPTYENNFINVAFTPTEIAQILYTRVNDNYISGETIDRIFLLNYTEVENYFKNSTDRKADSTYYAVKQGATVKGSSSGKVTSDGSCIDDHCFSNWWLRISSIANGYISFSHIPLVSYDGNYASNDSKMTYGVRPALWIACASGYVQINGACQVQKSCDSTKETYNSTTNTCACNRAAHWAGTAGSCTCESGSTLVEGHCIPTNLSVGDSITFGHYEQDDIMSNGKEPISWRVLDKNANGQYLIISEKALDVKPYHLTRTPTTWEKSTIRSWLNGYGASYNTIVLGTDFTSGVDFTSENFIDAAFTTEEKARIVNAYVPAHTNPKYSTPPGNPTEDRIFLLSITEAEKYFTSDDDSKASPTPYAYSRNPFYLAPGVSLGDYISVIDSSVDWWLRSPGQHEYSAASILFFSSAYSYYAGSYVDGNYVAVRPALWVNL